jgi:hypothetical protein
MPSMIVKQNFIPTLKKVAFAATAIIGLAQCSEEEIVPTAVPAAVTSEQTVSSSVQSVSSFTVTGINAIYNTAKDCSTCTFIIPGDATVVNGKELGVKPGDVICLNSIYKYGDLELINIEGTSEKPVSITTVGNFEQTTEGSDDATSVSDPY